jgi:NAD(P)-dependent dehydrogenase (short-subunit alcohol dehydrogenase family)
VTAPLHPSAGPERLLEALAGRREAVTLIDGDLTDEGSVRALVDRMERVDVLIHLVGGFAMGDTHAFSTADFRALIELNLTSAFLACKHSLRRMRENGYGRIVTIGSRAAEEPGAGQAAYAAAKAGVVAMTRAVARETRGTDITANCVLPSVIDTPKNRVAMGESDSRSWVRPESLAEVVVFLASRAARDVRGAAVAVYGRA